MFPAGSFNNPPSHGFYLNEAYQAGLSDTVKTIIFFLGKNFRCCSVKRFGVILAS